MLENTWKCLVYNDAIYDGMCNMSAIYLGVLNYLLTNYKRVGIMGNSITAMIYLMFVHG